MQTDSSYLRARHGGTQTDFMVLNGMECIRFLFLITTVNTNLWEIPVDIFSMQGSFQDYFIIFSPEANSIWTKTDFVIRGISFH